MIVLDTETEAFAPARMAPRLVVLSVGGAGGADLIHHSEAEPVVAALLASDELLVGHHIAYDMAVLGAAYPHLLPAIFAKYDRDQVADTAVRQKLIDLAAGTRRQGKYSLAALASRLLGLELAKGDDTWRTRYAELRDLPVAQWPEEARAYAETDVTTTARVYAAQGAPHPDEYRQARASFWLQLASCWGVITDPVAVDAFETDVRARYEALSAQLVEAGVMRPARVNRKGRALLGSRDTKAAMTRMEAAYAAQGREPPRTETGRISLDDAACRASGDPLLEAYAELASVSKQLSTDVPLLRLGTTQPIHTRFESLLETGRISSSNPNLTNLAR